MFRTLLSVVVSACLLLGMLGVSVHEHGTGHGHDSRAVHAHLVSVLDEAHLRAHAAGEIDADLVKADARFKHWPILLSAASVAFAVSPPRVIVVSPPNPPPRCAVPRRHRPPGRAPPLALA